ncbi:hypothetical protein TCAL_15522 [Tigriopus californicus]|uniref:RNA-directed DNA polymerase n=1 Tax=Tigriopus californicus TaxID=6832 RepID=A0A553PTL4_TIGCA|nr:hypothetical protein TCAL_15522 [Tigriopus californicus]
MRSLLKKNTAYLWSPEIDAEFNHARKILSSPLLVQPFDPSLETHLLTDPAKKHGLGYGLIQYDTPRVYKNIWDELSLIDDGNEGYLLTWGDRIVIPHRARNEILSRLHFSHQGLTKTSLAAKSSYYWPGMNNDLKTLIASCTACQKYQASQFSEPLQSYTLDQTFPTQLMAADLFDFTGINFLAIVDAYSGLAKSAVKNAKMLLRKCKESDTDFSAALHEFRCLPRPNSLSPNQLFFGRQPRGLLPTLVPQDVPLDPTLLQNRNLAKIKNNQQTDESARLLTPLLPGTAVLVQHPVSKIWGQTSIVLHPLDNGRSYESECSISGKRFRRNHKFIRKFIADDALTHDLNIPGSISSLPVPHTSPPPLLVRRSSRISQQTKK